MLGTLFLKKLFYFFTTGTVLFYLISYESNGSDNTGGISTTRLEMLRCQQSVKDMNNSRVYTLKEKFEITYRNILKQSLAEQKAVHQFLKDQNLALFKDGREMPLRVSSYKFESSSHETLGYRIVIQALDYSTDEVTYFMGREGEILFTYANSLIPIKEWTCENKLANSSDKFF